MRRYALWAAHQRSLALNLSLTVTTLVSVNPLRLLICAVIVYNSTESYYDVILYHGMIYHDIQCKSIQW